MHISNILRIFIILYSCTDLWYFYIPLLILFLCCFTFYFYYIWGCFHLSQQAVVYLLWFVQPPPYCDDPVQEAQLNTVRLAVTSWDSKPWLNLSFWILVCSCCTSLQHANSKWSFAVCLFQATYPTIKFKLPCSSSLFQQQKCRHAIWGSGIRNKLGFPLIWDSTRDLARIQPTNCSSSKLLWHQSGLNGFWCLCLELNWKEWKDGMFL